MPRSRIYRHFSAFFAEISALGLAEQRHRRLLSPRDGTTHVGKESKGLLGHAR
jgi:hypothetical protein